jgi:hypothetical protein
MAPSVEIDNSHGEIETWLATAGSRQGKVLIFGERSADKESSNDVRRVPQEDQATHGFGPFDH